MPESIPSSRAEAASALRAVAERVLSHWLENCVRRVIHLQQINVDETFLAQKIDSMVVVATPAILQDLDLALSGARADNPLQVFRRGVSYPTEVLSGLGVKPVIRDEFSRRSFPNDVFGLSPATWKDIDERLHDPGIIWGAWTAREAMNRDN